MTDALLRTSLYDLHVELGAKMVPFAGYEMPVQYPLGVMKEHLWTREHAGLFDVGHMGQIIVRPKSGDVTDALAALETLMPVDALGLGEGRQRYGLLTTDEGGIADDLMFANRGDHVLVVVNAATKEADFARMEAAISGTCDLSMVLDRGLIALQGPDAEAALEALVPGVAEMRFMDSRIVESKFGELWISRSGYTGEDGYEISVDLNNQVPLVVALLADARVEAIGLGARDSLRLEAGLCLYGTDIDETTSPVEAGLIWAMQKVRRPGGARAGGFPGEARIFKELEEGASRKRVGLLPEGRAPMRGGTALFSLEGEEAGVVTSGAFGPTLGAPVAMGYVATDHAATATELAGEVRGKRLPVSVAPMPFVPANFKR